MNGMDYVNMRMVYQPVQDFYEMLRKDPGFDWLSKNYQAHSAQNPMEEWRTVQEKVRRVSKWENVLVGTIMCALACPYLLVGIILQGYHASDQVEGLIMVPMLAAYIIMVPVMKNRFVRMWRELAKGWLVSIWETKEFTDDTWNLCVALGGEHGFSLKQIRETLVSRHSDKQGKIPLHVARMTEETLLGAVRPVICKNEGVASAIVSFTDDKRKEAKSALKLFQSFGIIPPDREVGYYYRLAEQVKQEKEK